MGKLYRDIDEIAIPGEAYVNTYDDRVYVKQVDGLGKEHRVVIGKATSATTMAPNDTFRALFPSLWEAAYGRDETDRLVVDVGTYAIALGAGLKSGVYRIVQAVYGPDTGNALMDFAMYLLLAHTDPASRTTPPIEDRLADEVTFCPTVRSSRWFADTFATLTDDQHELLRTLWLRHCVELGVSEVWLCVGAPVGDHLEATVTPIEVIDAHDGRPVTYLTFKTVDTDAIRKAIAHLAKSGMTVRGVVLDQASCAPTPTRALTDLGITYLTQLPHDTEGFRTAFAEQAGSIRWNPERLVDETGVFGIASRRRMWDVRDDEAHVSLFFDGMANATQSEALIRRVTGTMERAQVDRAGGRRPQIEQDLATIVRVVEDEDGRVTDVVYDHDAWGAALAEMGYTAIACSTDELEPREVWEAWRLCEASRGPRLALPMPESKAAKLSTSAKSALALALVAHVLYHEVRMAAGATQVDCDRTLREVGRMRLIRSTSGIYTPTGDYTTSQLALLSDLGIAEEDLALIARDVRLGQMGPAADREHHLPERPPAHRKGPGRTKGSKNKKTLEREAEIERQKIAGTYVEPPKRKPGRPKGSKDIKPRKKRSDAGVKRGPRTSRPDVEEEGTQQAE